MEERPSRVIWSRVMDHLRARIGDRTAETWFHAGRFIGIRDRTALLQLQSEFVVERVSEHYLELLRECFRMVCGDDVVNVAIDARAAHEESPSAHEERRGALLIGNLLEKFTFANFVNGNGNAFAHAAAQAVASYPGDRYNPFFIYGAEGLRKTHHIHAIGHRILEENSRMRMGCFSTERFTSELIAALRSGRSDEFKARFRNLDVLIIDDVQFLEDREMTQDELLYTFIPLYESGRQIILSSSKCPNKLPRLDDALRSRFAQGLVVEVTAPDFETRLAIVLKKAEMENLALPEDVAVFLASTFDANVRQLEGSFTRVKAFASLAQEPITIGLARNVLRDLM
jgi:chromosomal replication initiator protein